MLARFVLTAPAMPPEAPHHRREHRLPPRPPMPLAQVAAKVACPGRLSHEHGQSEVAARFVQESIDEAGLLLGAQLGAPQIIEVALFHDASRREMAAGQRVADAEAEEIVLKTGGFADESRVTVGGALLEMKIHVGVAGARLGRYRESMECLRRGQRMIEVVVNPFEIRDDRASEGRETVEDEKIEVAARR